MIKVLTKKLIHTCLTCKADLEYEHTDLVKEKINIDYLGDWDWGLTLICPVCKTKNIVKVV